MSAPFVAFVTAVAAPKQVNPDKPYFSNVASTRLRVLIPARQLARRMPVWLVPLQEFIRQPDLSHLGRPGAIVLGKLSSKDLVENQSLLAQLLRRLAGDAPATMLFADLSDDYAALGEQMRQPFLAEYQESLGRLCSLIVPCAALSAALTPFAKRGLTVIEDPYENPQRPVRACASAPLRLAWFGNLGVVNEALLEAAFERLASTPGAADSRLEVVASDKVRERVLAMGARLRARSPGLGLVFTPWSLEATEAAIERSDFVLLPQEYRSAWGKVKSHNRLVCAIRGGRLAIASPIPAYEELAAYAWVGEDLGAGLQWALAHPAEAAARVSAGQRYAETRFSPEAVGRKWAEALKLP